MKKVYCNHGIQNNEVVCACGQIINVEKVLDRNQIALEILKVVIKDSDNNCRYAGFIRSSFIIADEFIRQANLKEDQKDEM